MGQQYLNADLLFTGAEGLIHLKEKLTKCLADNNTPVPKELAKFPAIPDNEKIPTLPTIQKVIT